MCNQQIKTVFIHGFLGDQSDWEGIAREGDLFLNLPIDETLLPKEPCHLVGYSMGGRIAMRLKTQYPDRFVKTVIISAHPGLDESEKQKRWEQDLAHVKELREGGLQQFLTSWYKSPIFAQFRECAAFDAIIKERSKKEIEPLAALLLQESVAKQPSYWEAIAGAHFLIGEEDSKYRALIPRLERAGAKTHIAKNCGHVLHLENPSWCRQQLEENLWRQ